MKVLLIDDEKSFHKILKILSNKFCFEVSCVYSLREAKSACDTSVDIAIIDYELPDGNGVSLNSDLKKKFPDLKTVLCSGHSELMGEALSNDFDFTLDKSEIVPFISQFMRERKPVS